MAVAVALTYTCEAGAGDIGLWLTVTQRQGTATVSGSAAGGFYNSERLPCTGSPRTKTVHVLPDGGFFKARDALFEAYMYTCCTTTSAITSLRITNVGGPRADPEPARNSLLQIADAGRVLAKGLAVAVPSSYRCEQPVVAGQVWARLTQKVDATKVSDDADPIQSYSGALTCDGAARTATLLFKAPAGAFFTAGEAFLGAGLEIYDGSSTETSHDTLTGRLTK